MQRLVLILSAGLVVLALYTFERGRQPDPNLINLAVRATVYAMPSPTAQIVEVTRVVEVTRMVEIVRMVEVTPTPLLSPTPLPSPTPTFTPTPLAAAPPVAPAEVRADAAVALAVSADVAPQTVAEQAPANDPAPVASGSCPAASGRQYTSIPVIGSGATHPDSLHGDLNLALRGYAPVDAALSLVDIDGPTDGDAPQLAGVLGRLPALSSAYQARDWNWGCGERGCRGDLLGHVEVSMVGFQTQPGEAVHVPGRQAEIYGGGFVALVVYADASRLTVVYTREDSVANGYAVHLEDICVDPNLLALYQANNATGRGSLPAVRNGEAVGSARYAQLLVGVRDRGAFTDPRSRKDWWRGY
jgi:hypothetical protein